MVAEAVKEAVGVGGDAGRGERDQRAERGGRALQRHLVEQVAVNVDVESGVVFDQVARGLDRDGLAPAGDLQHQLEADPDDRVRISTFWLECGKTVGGDLDHIRGQTRRLESRIGQWRRWLWCGRVR